MRKNERLMINTNTAEEVFVNIHDLETIKQYGNNGFKFANKRYNYLIFL